MEIATNDQVQGTVKKGIIECSYESLVIAFGEPHFYEPTAEKVQAQWSFSYDDQVITIYDYKEDQPVEKITNWHIGGKNWSDRYDGIYHVTETLRDYGQEVNVLK